MATNRTRQEIDIETNLDSFTEDTKKLGESWDDVYAKIQKGGVGAIKKVDSLNKVAGQMKKSLGSYIKLNDVIKHLNTKELAQLRAKFGGITKQFKTTEKSSLTLEKKAKKYNELLKKQFELVKQTNKIVAGEKSIREKLETIQHSTGKIYNEELRDQRAINDELIKRIMLDKDNLSFAQRTAQSMKLMAENVKLASEEASMMGKTLKTVGKAAEGLGHIVSTALGPIAALFTIAQVISSIFAGMSKLNKANKEISQAFAASGKSVYAFNSVVGDGTGALRTLADTIGESIDAAAEWVNSMVKAGFVIKANEDGITKVTQTMDAAIAMGVSFDEMTGLMASSFEEVTKGFDETLNAFSAIQKTAQNSGMVMSKFYTKVINAASGLAIYNTKLEEVAPLFDKMRKAMKLPQEVAAQLAQSLIKSFDEMDDSTEALSLNLTGVTKNVQDLFGEVKKGKGVGELKSKIEAIFGEGTAESVYKRLQSMAKLSPALEVYGVQNLFKEQATLSRKSDIYLAQAFQKEGIKNTDSIDSLKALEAKGGGTMHKILGGLSNDMAHELQNILKEDDPQITTVQDLLDKLTKVQADKQKLDKHGNPIKMGAGLAKDLAPKITDPMTKLENKLENTFLRLGKVLGDLVTKLDDLVDVLKRLPGLHAENPVDKNKGGGGPGAKTFPVRTADIAIAGKGHLTRSNLQTLQAAAMKAISEAGRKDVTGVVAHKETKDGKDQVYYEFNINADQKDLAVKIAEEVRKIIYNFGKNEMHF